MASPGDESGAILERWSNTGLKILRFRHQWKIMDFKLVPPNKAHILDRISSKCPDFGDAWDVSFMRIDQALVLSVTQAVTSMKMELLARFNFTVLEDNIPKLMEHSDVFCETTKIDNKPICETRYSMVFVQKFIRKDALTVACEVTMTRSFDIFLFIKQTQEMKFHTLESKLPNVMESILNNQDTGDFTFNFGDKKLRALKVILSARSPVFASMFDKNSNFKENQTDSVDILDIEYEVFREMLLYIYTDKVPKVETMARDLLVAADKYQLDCLKVMCEKTLYKNISIENALDTFFLSHKYRCEQLKIRTLEWISMHKKKILESDEFKKLLASDPVQAKAIIFEVFNLEEFPTNSEPQNERVVIIMN